MDPNAHFAPFFFLLSFRFVVFCFFFRLGGELGMGLEGRGKKHGRMKGKWKEGYGRSYH